MYINGFTRESVMKQIRANNLGYPAYSEDEQQCMYRAHNGNQCLVGCFIPDHLYEEDFEGEGAKVIYDKMPEKMPLVRPMLQELQTFHDGYRHHETEDFFNAIENELIKLETDWEFEND